MKQRPLLLPVTSKGLDQVSSETALREKMIEIQCWGHSEAIFCIPPKFHLVELYQSPLGVYSIVYLLPIYVLTLH